MYKGSAGLVVGIPVLCCSSEANIFLNLLLGMEGKRASLLLQPTAYVSFVSIVYHRNILGMKEAKVVSLPPFPPLPPPPPQQS